MQSEQVNLATIKNDSGKLHKDFLTFKRKVVGVLTKNQAAVDSGITASIKAITSPFKDVQVVSNARKEHECKGCGREIYTTDTHINRKVSGYNWQKGKPRSFFVRQCGRCYLEEVHGILDEMNKMYEIYKQ